LSRDSKLKPLVELRGDTRRSKYRTNHAAAGAAATSSGVSIRGNTGTGLSSGAPGSSENRDPPSAGSRAENNRASPSGTPNWSSSLLADSGTNGWYRIPTCLIVSICGCGVVREGAGLSAAAEKAGLVSYLCVRGSRGGPGQGLGVEGSGLAQPPYKGSPHRKGTVGSTFRAIEHRAGWWRHGQWFTCVCRTSV